jgi:hypothetical protein
VVGQLKKDRDYPSTSGSDRWRITAGRCHAAAGSHR